MSYIGKNPKFDSTILKDQAADSVANPAAGSDKLVNRNGSLFVKDSSGTEVELAELPVNLSSDVSGTLPVANGGTGVTTKTGVGSVVLSTAPSLTSPNLGTPTAATLTNATGLPIGGGTTGTLPLNRGGTGQTTQTAAFNALSPTTTKGDIIASDGTNNVRQAIGADGLILKADSTTSTGLVWGSAAAGTGEVNYIENPDAEANTTGWATYADAAGATPVDGTGGSANITFTRQDSVVLRGNQSFKLTKDGSDRQGEGVSYNFTIKEQDTSKKLKIQFDFKTDEDAGFSSGDLTVYVYDVTNSTLITPVDTSIIRGQNIYQTSFNSTTSTSYRLIFHIATTNASAWDAYIDNVIVGPGMTSQGAAIGPVETYVPQTSDFSNFGGLGVDSASRILYQRIGDSLTFDFFLRVTGSAGTDSGGLDFKLTNWLSNLGLTKTNNSFGAFGIFQVGVGGRNGEFAAQTDIDFYSEEIGSGAGQLVGNQFGTSSTKIRDISFSTSYQISEWSGKGIVPMLAEDNLSEWQTYNATINDRTGSVNVTYTNQTSTWRRVGDSMEVSGLIALGTVTVSPGTDPTIVLPEGHTIDADRIGDNFTLVGEAKIFDNGASPSYIPAAIYPDLSVGRNNEVLLFECSNQGIPSIAAGDQIRFKFTVPIAEWSGSQNSLVGYSEASSSNLGLVKKNKWQRKTLQSTVTGTSLNTTLTDLTFNNLTVGKTYFVQVNAHLVLNAPSTATEQIRVQINHNGTSLGGCLLIGDATTSDQIQTSATAVATFEAAATTVTFQAISNASNASTGVYVDSNIPTYSEIHELNNFESETTDFT